MSYLDRVRSNIRLALRHWHFWKQRRTRGWDDSELWNLDNTIAKFVLPRLRRFKEIHHGFPSNLKKSEHWDSRLDDMIFAMEQCVEVRHSSDPDVEKRIEKGLRAFAKYFRHLWD